MRKKLLFIICPLAIILIVATIYFLGSSNKEFSSYLSHATLGGGYSSQGVVFRENEPPYIRFLDFASSTEVALGIDPESTYDDPGSFAYTLNSANAELINIYDKKLYYITCEYDYDRREPYSIVVHEASLDGGEVNTIGEFIGYISCNEYYLSDGMMFLSLVKYDEDLPSSSISNKQNITVAVGCIDLDKRKVWTLPEKSGYGAYILFTGYYDGIFNYVLRYQTEPIDSLLEEDVEAWSIELAEKSRITLWSYDTDKQEETTWDDNFTDIIFEEVNDNIYFQQWDNQMYVTTFHVDDQGDEVFNFVCYDIESKEIMQEFSAGMDEYGSYNPNMAGDLFIFKKWDETFTTVISRTVFDGATGKEYLTTEFNDYFIQERINDKLLLCLENEDSASYGWITIDDFLNDNIDGLHMFKKGY